jgi:pyruvate, water dikinase
MDSVDIKLSTGLPGFDQVLKGLIPGDNVVWRVDSIEDYQAFVTPYVRCAARCGHRLVYFRFASHPPLLDETAGAEIHTLNPEEGFENFIASIHAVIERMGRGAFYVFDCLSELAGDWYSDQMLGNFFMLTCPYLFDLETIAYFALFRDRHSPLATDAIAETTQLLLDVVRHDQTLYVRPVKVQHRYSSTMNMLHEWTGDKFLPVTSSAVISEILAGVDWGSMTSNSSLDMFTREVMEARELIRSEQKDPARMAACFNHLSRMIVSRDPVMHSLVSRHLTIEDILDVARRMIGTGLIGGKAVGMLLARGILRRSGTRMAAALEPHDSFFIGSDVFYTYLVRNGIWWVRQKQRNAATFLEGSEVARRRILTGRFPDYVVRQFEAMLDYFGQSPFIVRSSSLLEDNFGNSFAGKYDSVFCTNQGPRERRLEDFMAAVKTIYASTMSEKALRYRAQRGLLEMDEQMALLVMRVSGSLHDRKFFPAVAGVGFSFNPFKWHESIDPAAGVVRLVFGLGTRAVNRSDDDYTRLVALNEPSRRPEASADEIRQYAQRRVDYLDFDANQLVAGHFIDVAKSCGDLPMELLTSRDRAVHTTQGEAPRLLTFDRLLSETPFVEDLRVMLSTLTRAYNHPVDTEFTLNFVKDGSYRINLVQCRPLQVQGAETSGLPDVRVLPEDRIIEARGAVVGQSRLVHVSRFVYVVPSRYGTLPVSTRYEIARLIGAINRASGSKGSGGLVLMGPGRWGTSSPELGIPVSFSEINRVSILCEIVAMRDDFVPDVSLGTHFLNELVETEMLYLALFPKLGGNYINESFFEGSPNRLLELAPDAVRWEDTVRVIDAADVCPPGVTITVAADAFNQKVVAYFDRK